MFLTTELSVNFPCFFHITSAHHACLIYLLLPLLYFFPFIFFSLMYIVQLYCSELLLLKKLHLLVGLNRTSCPVPVVRKSSNVRIPDRLGRALPLGSYARTPVERYEMWFEIIYWQPCNFCFAYMPGRPKGSVSCLAWAWQPR